MERKKSKPPFTWDGVNMDSDEIFTDDMGKNIFNFMDKLNAYSKSGNASTAQIAIRDGKGRKTKQRRFHFTGQL